MASGRASAGLIVRMVPRSRRLRPLALVSSSPTSRRQLIVDEAARVPDELYHAVRPMLAVSGGQIVLLSTPFGSPGFFFDMWEDGGAAWVADKRGAYASLAEQLQYRDFYRDGIVETADGWFWCGMEVIVAASDGHTNADANEGRSSSQ